MKWREWSRKICWLEATVSELEVVDELEDYMAYCCAARGNQVMTMTGKLVTAKFRP